LVALELLAFDMLAMAVMLLLLLLLCDATVAAAIAAAAATAIRCTERVDAVAVAPNAAAVAS